MNSSNYRPLDGKNKIQFRRFIEQGRDPNSNRDLNHVFILYNYVAADNVNSCQVPKWRDAARCVKKQIYCKMSRLQARN